MVPTGYILDPRDGWLHAVAPCTQASHANHGHDGGMPCAERVLGSNRLGCPPVVHACTNWLRWNHDVGLVNVLDHGHGLAGCVCCR